VEGVPLTTPAARTFIVGSRVSIGVASPQTLGGTAYSFHSWSDGQPRAHDIIATTSVTTYRATFSAPGAGGLPSGWTSRDIGSGGPAGRASSAGGTVTVIGGGPDIWGTADGFHFAYRPLIGDGTIVARVGSASGADPWTKVGVMLRASTAAGSPHAFMFVSTGKGTALQRRRSAGGASIHTAGPPSTAPRWVKLARIGNLVRASISTDGTTWTVVGQDTIALPATALVGLAVTSHTTTATATGTFDNVDVRELPDGWDHRDIGTVGPAGSSAASNGIFTITGGGADIWGTADAFQFAWRTLGGDGQIVARVATLTGSDPWAKAGVMIRQSLAANSPHAFMLVSTQHGAAFQRRTRAGGTSTHTAGGAGAAPRWVRLSRAGSTITAAVSNDGATWTTVGSTTIAMTNPVYIGLAVTSHTTAATATATFDNVAPTP
jgi:regulation of enolase protein 1 (concanavalin A-like superfamily)